MFIIFIIILPSINTCSIDNFIILKIYAFYLTLFILFMFIFSYLHLFSFLIFNSMFLFSPFSLEIFIFNLIDIPPVFFKRLHWLPVQDRIKLLLSTSETVTLSFFPVRFMFHSLSIKKHLLFLFIGNLVSFCAEFLAHFLLSAWVTAPLLLLLPPKIWNSLFPPGIYQSPSSLCSRYGWKFTSFNFDFHNFFSLIEKTENLVSTVCCH